MNDWIDRYIVTRAAEPVELETWQDDLQRRENALLDRLKWLRVEAACLGVGFLGLTVIEVFSTRPEKMIVLPAMAIACGLMVWSYHRETNR